MLEEGKVADTGGNNNPNGLKIKITLLTQSLPVKTQDELT